jgi:hypothetical protein
LDRVTSIWAFVKLLNVRFGADSIEPPTYRLVPNADIFNAANNSYSITSAKPQFLLDWN